jgi:hypothetical protein
MPAASSAHVIPIMSTASLPSKHAYNACGDNRTSFRELDWKKINILWEGGSENSKHIVATGGEVNDFTAHHEARLACDPLPNRGGDLGW